MLNKISNKNVFWMTIAGIILLIIGMSVAFFVLKTPKRIFAFPGAEGFGAYATGGRGGAVYHVTSLKDTNDKGTLRYAINQKGARNIIFDISGPIELSSPLIITDGDLTIAGQTAPGAGICLKNYPLIINADNIIIRYLRIRPGENYDGSSLQIHNRKDIIIDHCSISWGTDNNIDITNNANVTVQWSIISEALTDTKFALRGYGASIGGFGMSFHHNLLAHNNRRNPLFIHSNSKTTANIEYVDFRNNILYNWGENNAEGIRGASYNIVNNSYKFGPASKISVRSQIVETVKNSRNKNFVYVNGNFVFMNPLQTNDNKMGVYPNMEYIVTSKNSLISAWEFPHEPITMHSANTAFEKVLNFAGASLNRDFIDTRVTQDVRTGAFYKAGSYGGSKGLINSPKDVGGYPMYDANPPLVDSDKDGMPDKWEFEHKHDPFNPKDGKENNLIFNDYTNLEVYMNSLVDGITIKQNSFPALSKDLFWLSIQRFSNFIKK